MCGVPESSKSESLGRAQQLRVFEIIEMPDVQSFFVSHIVRSAVMYGEL
jgi:hypothetical protein